MIKKYNQNDLSIIMEIWLNTNIQAHDFIPEEYWISNYKLVQEMILQSEIYVYKDVSSNRIDGFIGLTDNYIAGIFVRDIAQSKGIGKQLLDYVKSFKSYLTLNVYKKNKRAIQFYQREKFLIVSENYDVIVNENELSMIWENS